MDKQNLIFSLKVNKGKELLPIGTVVNIDLVDQAIMIYGRKQKQVNEEKIWDYVACPYPQGHLSDDTNVFFDHEHITNVVFKGFESEGELILHHEISTAAGDNQS